MKKCMSTLIAIVLTTVFLAGCGNVGTEKEEKHMTENVVLTETGEVLVKEQPTIEPKEENEITDLEAIQEIPEKKEQISINDVQIDVPLQQGEEVEETPAESSENKLQIVFLGDSIFDGHRDGTGVPYLTAVQCDANMYNLAIGGTSATLEEGEPSGNENWTSRSMLGVVKAMMGYIPTDVFEGTVTKKILDDPDVDFTKTDYFVVEYGINDFFRAVPLDDPEDPFDHYAYVGALRYAIATLSEIAPDATIILCTPHYCQFFNNNQYVGDSNILHNGYGTLFDYKGKCSYVAREQNVEFLDAYFDLGIDGYTAKEYLEDGVHLTEEGRKLYADALAKKILKFEETKNN